MSEIVQQPICNPCMKKSGIPPAYMYPYHSRGYQSYPEPAKPPRIPSDLRKSIEQERRASMTKEELKEYRLSKTKKHHKQMDVQAILNNLACPEPKEKVVPPKPRKPPPGVSLAYWKLKQEGFMKPPPAKGRRREKFAIHEPSVMKQSGFPLYESPSYLAAKPKYRFTPKKKLVVPSPAVKSIVVRRYGRQLMGELDSLKNKFNAYDDKPHDFTNLPVNRLDWACEKFRECASANVPAWYNLLRNYVLGPPHAYFFHLSRPEALECWERMQVGNYQVKDCCVEKPKYKSFIPVIPSLKSPPKKFYDPCEEFRRLEAPEEGEEYETDEEELEEMMRNTEVLLLHQRETETNRKSKFDDEMIPALKKLGNKSSVDNSLEGNEYDGEDEGEGFDENDQERFIRSNSVIEKPLQLNNVPSLTQLEPISVAKVGDQEDGCAKPSQPTAPQTVFIKPPHFPPFCDPVPNPDRRLPWQIPPLKPREGDEEPFSFPYRTVDLGDVISVLDDPYGELRKMQKKELKRKIRWAMLRGFFQRNGMPAVETMKRLMYLNIPEDHPLNKFKLNKALHKLLFLKDINTKGNDDTVIEEEVDTEKLMQRAAARMRKADFSHIKSKYLEPSGRFRKIMWH